MVQVWYKIANLTDGSNLRCKTIANQKQSPYFILKKAISSNKSTKIKDRDTRLKLQPQCIR